MGSLAAVAYIIYFRLLATAGATNLLLVTFLIPVSALILGMGLVGERLDPEHGARPGDPGHGHGRAGRRHEGGHGSTMRTLVLGAGAVGGYFGGRLLEAGRDVTFLVRPRRAAELAATGLVIRSRFGDAASPAPVVLPRELREPFDLILLTCKAYDLEAAMDDIAPAVGPNSTIVPLLNGMRHLDALDARFGAERVLGGLCYIAATLDGEGRVIHLNDAHALRFGERDGRIGDRARAIAALFEPARASARASDAILAEMWEKWVMLASLAGMTSLMRASVGDIVAAPGGEALMLQMFEECRSIAAAAGFEPRPQFVEQTRALLTAAGSPLTASMLRDVERGGPTEAGHVLGDLLARAERLGMTAPLLRVAYCHLQAYESRRGRAAPA